MFELSVAKNQLLPALMTIAGAVDKRQSLAILSNILLIVNDDHLQLTATDLEIEMSACLNCHSSSEAGRITVSAKKIIDIVRSLDDEEMINCKLLPNAMLLSSGRSQFKLATLPAEQYPNSEIDKNKAEFTLPRQSLIKLLQATYFAMSQQQDVRIFLNGLLWEIEGSVITTVSTDGHRMAIYKFSGQFNSPPQRLLLPRKSVQEMLRLLNSITDDLIQIAVGKSHFRLSMAQYNFSTKLIEARFPPYIKAIPTAQDKFVLIQRDVLKRALSRIVILANEKSRAVLLHVKPDMLTLIANNQEQEEATEALEAQIEGEEIKIGINATYLLDVLNYFAEGLVRLSMSTMERSILVESLVDEHYQYIIMPMKI